MKTKKYILAVVLIALFTHSQAQSYINSIYENILYGGVINSNSSTVHELNDTIYLFGAQTLPQQPELGYVYGFGAYKIGPAGELLDELAVVSDTMQIAVNGHGGVHFVNGKFYVPYFTAGPDTSDHRTGVMIYNRELELVDEWLFGDPDYTTRILKIIESGDGGYLVCGLKVEVLGSVQSPYDYGYLAKLDENGNLLWERTIPTSIIFDYIDIDSNGDIFLGGSVRYLGQQQNIRDHLLVKLQSNGEEIWRYVFGGSGSQGSPPLKVCDDGSIVVAGWEGDQELGVVSGPMKIRRFQDLGEDFEIIQEKTFSGSIGQKNEFFTLTELENGNFIAAGYQEYYYNNDWPVHGFAMCLDSNLDSLWTRHFYYFESLQSFHYIYDVKESEDGGLVMCGNARSSGQADPGSIANAWLLKLDEYGCLEPGCQLLNGVENHVLGLQEVMQVFPNPSNGEFNIAFDIPAAYDPPSTSFLSIFNQQGQEVLKTQIRSNEFENYQLDLSSMSKGIYLVQWHTEKEWLDNVKVVLQ